MAGGQKPADKLRFFSDASVAIDRSKFNAANNRDKNFTDRKLEARLEQLEQSIARYIWMN